MNQASNREPAANWCANVQRAPGAVLHLICFPYAGGSSITYHNWISSLPPAVSVYPVQLPGHGGRWREQPFTDMFDLVEEALHGLEPLLQDRFVFFGHSMGALIAFEMARRLAAANRPGPEKLYVSGRKAPHCALDEDPAYLLPNHDFVKRLRDLNGTPSAILDDPEMLELILPVVRADFKLVQTYRYVEQPPLACPISVFGGEADSHVHHAQLAAWARHTSASFSVDTLPGDHFFLVQQKRTFLQRLSRDLEALLKSGVVPHSRLALSGA